MAEISFWYEFASTYSYPAAMRLDRLSEAAGVKVRWRPFLLGPLFAELGRTTSPFNLQPAKGAYMWRDLARICARDGLVFRHPDPFPQHVEDGIHDLAHRPLAGSTGVRRRRQKRRDDRPLRVGEIASITKMLAAMLPSGGRGPHEVLQTGFDNRLESHLNLAIHPRTAFQDSLLVRRVGSHLASRVAHLSLWTTRFMVRGRLDCASPHCTILLSVLPQ